MVPLTLLWYSAVKRVDRRDFLSPSFLRGWWLRLSVQVTQIGLLPSTSVGEKDLWISLPRKETMIKTPDGESVVVMDVDSRW